MIESIERWSSTCACRLNCCDIGQFSSITPFLLDFDWSCRVIAVDWTGNVRSFDSRSDRRISRRSSNSTGDSVGDIGEIRSIDSDDSLLRERNLLEHCWEEWEHRCSRAITPRMTEEDKTKLSNYWDGGNTSISTAVATAAIALFSRRREEAEKSSLTIDYRTLGEYVERRIEGCVCLFCSMMMNQFCLYVQPRSLSLSWCPAHPLHALTYTHKLSRSSREEKRERGDTHTCTYIYIYIVTPAGVKWSIFIVRTRTGERTNGRSQEKGQAREGERERERETRTAGSTNRHLSTHIRPSRVKWTDEKASPDGQLHPYALLLENEKRMYALANKKRLENIICTHTRARAHTYV